MALTDPVIQANNIPRTWFTWIPKIRIIVQFLSGNFYPPKGVDFLCLCLTLQSLLFGKKKNEKHPRKARVFLFAESLKSLEKEGRMHKKKQGKSGKQKSKEIEKKKKEKEKRRVRVHCLWYRTLLLLHPHFFPWTCPIAIQRQDAWGGHRRKNLSLKPIAL